MDHGTEQLFLAAFERLRECKSQLSLVAAAEELSDGPSKDDYIETETKHFSYLLERAYRTIILIHEKLDQTESLKIFQTGVSELHKKDLPDVTFFDGDANMPESATLDYLTEELVLLNPLIKVESIIDAQRKIAWTILEQTNVVVRQQGLEPSKEKDVQDALSAALIIPFPDTIREPSTAKQTKTYKPDFAIQSLQTAIEVKFVAKEEGVGAALGELYEDMHGYAGNPEWSMFMGVIYLTGPYLSQKRLEAEMKKANVPKSWQVCVSVGSGKLK